jgi:DNA polymerase I-like protein with 3'-5' exonuclease and polymerase domains
MIPKFLTDLNPKVFESENYGVLDFETTNNEKGSALAVNPENRVVAWVLLDGRTGKRIRQYTGELERSFARLLKYVGRFDFIVAHNAKFELQWLYKCGLEPGSVLVYDTMVGEYVLAGNRKWELSLDATARRYGIGTKESLVSALIKGGVCPSTIPDNRLLDYCEQDVLLTQEVFKQQREKIIEAGLLPVMYTRCLTTVVLSDVERNGMMLDVNETKLEFEKTVRSCKKAMGRVADLTGGINPKSYKQVGEFLYDHLGFPEPRDFRGEILKTDGGGRRTDEETILGLMPTTEEQQKFVEAFIAYIPLKKRLETVTKLYGCATNEQILLARFNQCVTASHRLSSSGNRRKVQFQNIDRDLKRLFIPRHSGWKIGDSDAPQVEFRVAAELGNDTRAKQDIRDKFDVHTYTAQVLGNKVGRAVTKSERTNAKSHTFKPLYGGMSGTPDEKRYYKAFREKYRELYKTQQGWTFKVLGERQLQIPSGLVFYWPDVEIYEHGYIKGTTEIFNYPIQSFATADIIPITLIYLYYRLKEHQTFVVNTVHDSIICEVAPGEEEIWEESVKRAYTTDVFNYLKVIYGFDFETPLGVSYNLGVYWGDGKEELFEVDPMTYSGTLFPECGLNTLELN